MPYRLRRSHSRTGHAVGVAIALFLSIACAAGAQIVINEIDYDQPGTDFAEFIELKNVGPAAESLDPYALELVNGSGGGAVVYQTIDLPAVDLPAGGYYVVCGSAAQVAHCDLDVTPDSNLVQNGAPDAVALVIGASIIDTVSYEGNTGAPYTEGSGVGLEDLPAVDLAGISRFPDGVDTNVNNVDLSLRCATPGRANVAQASDCVPPELVINEIDYDQAGTDVAEFLEIKNAGSASVNLDAVEVRLVNGSGGGAVVYQTIDLPAVDLPPGGYYVICGDAAQVDNCDLDVTPDSNLIQNGAPDAVALALGGEILDTVSYEGDTGAPYTEGSGTGLEDVSTVDLAGISRFPDGVDTDVNNVDLSLRCITPGLPNVEASEACAPAETPTVVINEIDYDQAGTDIAEFIELKNTGEAPVNLDALEIQLVNGSGGGAAIYQTIDLPAVDLPAGGYYVVCGDAAQVPGCDLDVTPDSNLVQNGGPDAVALAFGGAILDTVSYEGDTGAPYTEGSGVGLEDLSTVDFAGISRFPDGVDTNVNNVDLSLRCITPGAANGEAGADCAKPVRTPLVINEIDYDQVGTDAAEFIELKNVGNQPLDLSTYTLELVNGSGGGAAVYQTIALPAIELAAGRYFVVCGDAAMVRNCDLDVSPDTNLVQNGAPDAVGLRLAGTVVDAVSYEGDTGAPYTEGSGVGLEDNSALDYSGISRLPDGADTDRNNVDLGASCITPGSANTSQTTDCGPLGPTYEIYEIQGAGLTSPLVGLVVATEDNVVTGVGPQGFFIQTPAARSDGDPETSDGIYVFTSSPPAVGVGDQVDVVARVSEFFDLTELGSGPSVFIDSSGNALPEPVVFDAVTPSPDQPQPANELERYEGMLVTFSGIATGPTDRFGDTAVVATTERAYREPGILYPGLPDLPVWDGNPQVFEIDANALGLPDEALFTGQSVAATGPLSYAFGDYQVWPTELSVGEPPALPRPVPARGPGELTVATQNMFRLFDDQDDPLTDDPVLTPQEFADRLSKLSLYLRQVLGAPDILGVEEVENLSTLQALADRIAMDDPTLNYAAYLEEGNDIGGIDVGFLARTDTIAVDSIEQYGKDEIFDYDGSLLNDRPPLILTGAYIGGGGSSPLTVIVVHQRSLSGIDGNEGERVKRKRLAQAQSLAGLIQERQTADPSLRLVVTGDFNAFQFTDGYVDVLGQVTGNLDPLGDELDTTDIVDPDLANQVLSLAPEERYSYVFDGSAQVLDHMLTSAALAPLVRGVAYGRADADAPASLGADPTSPLRVSDHDGLVLYLAADSDGDGVTDDLDVCPGTVIPEGVPTESLGVNRWALVDGDGIFDTVLPNGKGSGRSFTVAETGGCSCEQIIEALHLGEGHRKFGCSNGVMDQWVAEVNP